MLEKYKHICNDSLNQNGAELINIQIDLSTGSSGPMQHNDLQVDEKNLYTTIGMARFRVKLFSRLREYFVSSLSTIEMTNNFCSYLQDKQFLIASEQLLIDEIISKVEELRLEFVNEQFTMLLNTESSIKKGNFSNFFGTIFPVNTVSNSYFPTFDHCILGNMPKSLFNSQELEFARFLDSLNIPWVKTTPGFKINFPYPLGTFYPDFVITPDIKNGQIKTTFYVETKGGHLLNTQDSLFKKKACEVITSISQNKIKMVFGGFSECVEIIKKELG